MEVKENRERLLVPTIYLRSLRKRCPCDRLWIVNERKHENERFWTSKPLAETYFAVRKRVGRNEVKVVSDRLIFHNDMTLQQHIKLAGLTRSCKVLLSGDQRERFRSLYA